MDFARESTRRQELATGKLTRGNGRMLKVSQTKRSFMVDKREETNLRIAELRESLVGASRSEAAAIRKQIKALRKLQGGKRS
jgi:hypothetical protein